MTIKRGLHSASLGVAFGAFASAVASADPLGGAEGLGLNFFGDVRIRYEFAEDSGFLQDSHALTARARLAAELPLSNRLSLLAEAEAIGALIDDFDDGRSLPAVRPVVPDGDDVELNRFQISADLEPVSLVVGRQNLSLDDERFLGAVDFRQNQQTYDGVSFGFFTRQGVALDGGYIRRVNRVLGGEGDLNAFVGDSFFANASGETPLGRLSAFHYAFDLATGPDRAVETASSATTGVRLEGRKTADRFGVQWEAGFARQVDFAGNPVDYRANYWLGGASADLGPASLSYRIEILGGGGPAFQTPLATLHKFQGEADVFLTTPEFGLIDHQAGASWRFGAWGPFRNIALKGRYHRFLAEEGRADLGDEIDVALSAGFASFGLSLIYADYRADTFANDARRIYVAVRKSF
ncbi:MAG: alginate export family protein [Pseudomonadota bacterium]